MGNQKQNGYMTGYKKLHPVHPYYRGSDRGWRMNLHYKKGSSQGRTVNLPEGNGWMTINENNHRFDRWMLVSSHDVKIGQVR